MISLSLSPDELTVGMSDEVTVNLVNSGSAPIFHADVRLRFPSGLSHLRGEKTISVDRLEVGETSSASMTLRARRAGTHNIQFRNSSFQDEHGRTHPLDNLSVSVEATSKPEETSSADDNSDSVPSRRGVPSKKYDVFISYNRSGASGMAGRLYDRLRGVFEENRIFYDFTTEGERILKKKIGVGILESRVVLLLIDQAWVEKINQDDPPDDENWVRLEAEYALHCDCACIPVLVDEAAMPKASVLPVDLKSLPGIVAAPLRSSDFEHDVETLLRDVIRQVRKV
jgi:hypothetical protein